MSFHVKDDFKARSPISQVPASWFNAIARFVNNLVGGVGIRIIKNDSGRSVVSLDEELLAGLRVKKDIGTPIDCTDTPKVLDTDGATIEWTAGGANGFVFDGYCKIAPQTATSNYTVYQRCRMTFSRDGLLVKGQLLADRVRIQARNA